MPQITFKVKKNQNITTTTYNFIDKYSSHLQTSLPSLPLHKNIIDENAARRRAMSEAGQDTLQDYIKSETIPNYDETVSKSLASLNSSLDIDQLKEKTQCECNKNDQHFPTVVMDTVYNASIETMYCLLFNSSFMEKFLTEVEKSTGKIHNRTMVISILNIS